jgi:predicted MFS family arabinose efflux permease
VTGEADRGREAGSPARAPSLLRSWAFWGAVVLLLLSQAVYLGLSLISLQRFERSSMRLLEDAVMDRVGRRLSLVADMGVPLDAYRGLGAEVEAAAARSGSAVVVVADPSGRVLAGRSPERLLDLPAKPPAPEESFGFASAGRDWRAWPVFDGRGRLQGLVCLLAGREAGLGRLALGLFGSASGRRALALLALTSVLTGAALVAGSGLRARGRLGLGRLRLLVLAPFLLGMAAFSSWSLPTLFGLHIGQARDLARAPLAGLAADLDRLRSRGVGLGQARDLGPHLDRLRRRMPLDASLIVRQGDFRIASPADPPEVPAGLSLAAPLAAGGGVEVRLSPAAVRAARVDLSLDSLALAIISSLLLMELVRLMPGDPLGRRVALGPADGPGGPAPVGAPAFRTVGIGRLRPLIFAGLLATDLPLSFIPLKARDLGAAPFPIPPGILLGLPISVEMLMIGVAMVLGGRLARLLGGDWPLLAAGLLSAALGSVMSALAGGPMMFLLARALVGLGYGAFNMATHYLAAEAGPSGRVGESMGDLAAGFYSGGMCGCLIGGLLADRFGFDAVFVLAAVLFAATAALARIFLPRPAAGPAAPAGARGAGPSFLASFRTFLALPGVKAAMILSVLPVAASTTGVHNYFLPLHMSSLGYSPSMNSRLTLMMCLIIIGLGPVAGMGLDRRGHPVRWLAAAGFLAALSAASFRLWPALGGAVLGMAFLGLGGAIVESCHPAFIVGLSGAGDSRQSLSCYSGFHRLGQVGGPPVFGAVWGGLGLPGLLLIGLCTASASVVYLFLADRPPAGPGEGRGG